MSDVATRTARGAGAAPAVPGAQLPSSETLGSLAEGLVMSRQDQLDELARVALATDRRCPILHALEVGCGAVGIGASQEDLDEAIRRRTSITRTSEPGMLANDVSPLAPPVGPRASSGGEHSDASDPGGSAQ